MKRFQANKDGWYCGYWNDSPIQINFAERKSLYEKETMHYHKDFFEYYLVVKGWLVLEIERIKYKLKQNEMIAVEPLEKHKIIGLAKDGCGYISIKSKSYKGNKVLA